LDLDPFAAARPREPDRQRGVSSAMVRRDRRRWFEWCLNALLAAVLLAPLLVLLYRLLG
jgi:hypothetical protein